MAKEMTKHQREYAIERVNDLKRDAVYRIEQKHPDAPKVKSMSHDEQVRLVRERKVKMFPPAMSHRSYGTLDLDDVFDFESIKAVATKKAEAEEDRIQKAIRKETGPVYDEATRIIDQIMLGDAAEALALIEGFAKMCK